MTRRAALLVSVVVSLVLAFQAATVPEASSQFRRFNASRPDTPALPAGFEDALKVLYNTFARGALGGMSFGDAKKQLVTALERVASFPKGVGKLLTKQLTDLKDKGGKARGKAISSTGCSALGLTLQVIAAPTAFGSALLSSSDLRATRC